MNLYLCFGFVDCRNLKTLDKLTDQPGNLIPLDRGGVPDLSVSGDNFDLVEDDPHDPTTMSEPKAPMQSLNQLPVVINCHIPKFSFRNVNHSSHKKLKISKKNSFILT
jgi:hypothetical protein